MNFETYMNNCIPTWKTDLSMDVISDLERKFNKVKTWERTLETLNYNAYNRNKTGIDYSTDIEKALRHLTLAKAELESNIYKIKCVMQGSMEDEKVSCM